MIKTIIFDLGGVIILEPHDSWKTFLPKMAAMFGIDSDVLASEFINNRVRLQTGKMTLLDLFKKISSVSGRQTDPKDLLQKYLELYKESCGGEYDMKLLDIVHKLRRKFKVACFTNIEIEIAEFHRQKGLFNNFDYAFVSTEMGMRKPDLVSFQYVIKKLGINPSEGIFIDNHKAYVTGAKKAGLNGIVYTKREKLIKDLSKFIEIK